MPSFRRTYSSLCFLIWILDYIYVLNNQDFRDQRRIAVYVIFVWFPTIVSSICGSNFDLRLKLTTKGSNMQMEEMEQ